MADVEISSQELLSQIKALVSKFDKMELERVNEFGPGGQVAFCCGCVCVDKCVWNSSVDMKDLRILVEKGEVELPQTLNKLLAAELKK